VVPVEDLAAPDVLDRLDLGRTSWPNGGMSAEVAVGSGGGSVRKASACSSGEGRIPAASSAMLISEVTLWIRGLISSTTTS
jgi:hypothetical protein